MSKAIPDILVMDKNILTVASDGSCLKNPGGQIGWAWADDKGRWMANGAHSGTNQNAELLGLVSIFLAFPATHLHLQLDSQYTLNIADKWMHGWARAGWTRKGNEPIKNLDIVKIIYSLSNKRKEKGLTTTFQWVKGHGKNGFYELNDRADIRCGEAARKVKAGENPYLDSAGNLFSAKQDKLLRVLKMDQLTTAETPAS